jgi:hypothetical protein
MKDSHSFSLLQRFGDMECYPLANDAYLGIQ